MLNTIKRIFGTRNDRELKQMQPMVDEINKLESHMQQLSDDELKAQTTKFKELLKNGSSLDSILPEAFATVREASVRTLKMRHFDVQLLGGIALVKGNIAEMKTGEGKPSQQRWPLFKGTDGKRRPPRYSQ